MGLFGSYPSTAGTQLDRCGHLKRISLPALIGDEQAGADRYVLIVECLPPCLRVGACLHGLQIRVLQQACRRIAGQFTLQKRRPCLGEIGLQLLDER